MQNEQLTSDIVQFSMDSYYNLIDSKIREILERPSSEETTYDILDTEKNISIKNIILREKQRQMKIGEIWQITIGNYNGFKDLGVGHSTGLDIISETRKIIIELKNRTNTDNSSSKKTNFDKLARFKKENPEYTCIYANINDKTEEKTLSGKICDITHNGVIIQHQIGRSFLEFIFGNDTDNVINFMRQTIDKYVC